MNQRVVLLSKGASRDAIGGETVTWTEAATVWAEAKPIRGQEFIALQEAQSELQVRFTIRYRSDVTADWRLQWREQTYEIVGEPVDVNAARETLELNCRSAQT